MLGLDSDYQGSQRKRCEDKGQSPIIALSRILPISVSQTEGAEFDWQHT
jgi:hypothetical protein